MSERNLDFDTPVERKGTDCLKYDFAVERGMSPDILPLWVADMDFRISSYIQDALTAQAAHGIYGYSDSKEDYFAAVRDWMKKKHGWQVEEKWLVKTPGVVFALAMAVRAFTKEGEAVMIQQPVYYPFSSVIKDNGRKLVSNTLVQKEDGHYEMDLADFERKVKEEKVKLFLQERFGWQPYENKHYENVFTRFYEGYYLPHKFGYDKRKCYFSNEILAGTMTREEALAELEQPPYVPQQMEEDKAYIAKKLGLTVEEFQTIIDGENKTFRDYRNSWGLIQFGTMVLRALGVEKKKFR